jgi:CO dehydrogenase maturation factor
MPRQNQELALAIRAARLARELTQGDLATRVGVSQGTISFWENGVETPSLEHIISLALELPELVEQFPERERQLLQRILRLERELFTGRCACKGCTCGNDAGNDRSTTGRKEASMKIAITGKGGVGKTTIAGMIARLLARVHPDVLALDVDSNPNLALSLGIPRDQAAGLRAVPAGLTEWREDAEGHAYVRLRQPVDQFVAEYGFAAPDGVRLLVMGEVMDAGTGCRCSAHTVARGITGHLTSASASAVLDMEAGLEHLGRGTIEHVDVLLVVVEPYYRALEAASRIHDLATQLGVPRTWIVANRVRTEQEEEAIRQYCGNHHLELIAVIPYDEAVPTAEQQGLAPLDYAPEGEAVQAVKELTSMLRHRLASGQ